MTVSAKKKEVVLDRQSGDPDIMYRDHGSLASQLKEQTSIVKCRLLISKENEDSTAVQEAAKDFFVLSASTAGHESSSKLGEHYERDTYPLRPLKYPQSFRVVITEVTVPVRVDDDPHFHSSGSILC
jgi:hypothetical protein